MAEPLVSITYVSEAVAPLRDDELEALLAGSRTANLAHALTGMLLYRAQRFVQVLEGPERAVRDTIARIRRDRRHRDMRIVVDEPVADRAFAQWTMGYERSRMPMTPAPEGFRDSFDDLDAVDPALAERALGDIAVWFRARAARAVRAPDSPAARAAPAPPSAAPPTP